MEVIKSFNVRTDTNEYEIYSAEGNVIVIEQFRAANVDELKDLDPEDNPNKILDGSISIPIDELSEFIDILREFT